MGINMKDGYLFLTAFFICSGVHLYHSWTDEREKRAKTKPFLLLFLLLYYIAAAENRYAAAPSAGQAAARFGFLNMPLVLALLTSWLGDVLLIPHGHGWFAAGGISFMLCHFFFMRVYYDQITISGAALMILLPAAAIYFGIAFRVIRAVRENTPRIMVFPMYFYLLANSTMNLFALLQLISRPCMGTVTAFAGAVLFYVSDCCLFMVRYHSRTDLIFRKHFTVMVSYLLGEFLITQGMLMI